MQKNQVHKTKLYRIAKDLPVNVRKKYLAALKTLIDDKVDVIWNSDTIATAFFWNVSSKGYAYWVAWDQDFSVFVPEYKGIDKLME